jgi:hypothetical protein
LPAAKETAMQRTIAIHFAAVCLAAQAGCISSAYTPGGQNGAVYFDPDIQSSMDVMGCSTGNCHGGPNTPMHIVPPASGGSYAANYQQIIPRTQGGPMSLLLTKPVAGNSVNHGGGKLVAQNSPTYTMWLNWIQNGAPLSAPGGIVPQPDMGSSQPPPPTTSGPGGTPMGACVPVQQTTHQSHNAGQECLSCHFDITNAAFRWTVAGTLWQDQYGTIPRPGATVRLVDARGQQISMVTDVNGNFYTTQAVNFPLSGPAVSACPNSDAMNGKPTVGSCNQQGCHDAKLPMYLP